jgi:hypothetical protein
MERPWQDRRCQVEEWLNLIERALRTQVCFAAGKERKPRYYGIEVPWHFHILVASIVAIPKGLLEEIWRNMVSPAARRLQAAALSNSQLKRDAPGINIVVEEGDPVDDSIVVKSYDQNRLGPGVLPEVAEQLPR